ncbi:MAG: lipid-A-disaccharide synthase [Acidobacteriota bacterium]
MNQSHAESRSILLVVGETSADRYGASLVRRLRTLCSGRELSFFGTGGDEMQKAGVEILCHTRDLAIIGPREAFRHLVRYCRTYRLLTAACRERRPSVAVLLDFPDFNLRLAKILKRLGIKVIYYISPQLWAWRQGRIRTIRKYVDRMLVILPFEEEYYRVRGVNVEFVGHPLLEDFEANSDRERFLRELGLDPAQKTIAILPGSRRGEVEHILPTFLEASRLVLRHLTAQFLVSVAPAIDPRQVAGIASSILGENGDRRQFRIVSAPARTILANSDFGFIKCGTSTLEAALVGTPFLIAYKVSPLNWYVGNILVRSTYKGLVNLIAEEEIVPEYLQGDATPEALSRTALDYLEKPEKTAAMRARLAAIRNLLGSRCASERTAALVAGYLE